MEIISSSIDTSSPDFQQNSQHHKNLANELKERLARVREAIACGEFQIDARVIAERLIGRLLTS